MSDRYDHLCSEPECCSYKQKTFFRFCACHKTRETMMLERIAELEDEVRITQELADMARAALAPYTLKALDDTGREVSILSSGGVAP